MITLLPDILTLAQYASDSGEEKAALTMLGIFGAVFCGAMLFAIAVNVVLCLILSAFLKRLPERYRTQQPSMVWLLLIPLFSVIWNFFVFPKISESYKNYLDDHGSTDHADAGRSLAIAYSVLVCVSLIPYINMCLGPAALIVLIIYLVKINGYKSRIVPEGHPPMVPPAV